MPEGATMEVVHPHCAGLDVHKDEVVACARVMTGGATRYASARFPTTTRGLLALRDWLAEQGSTVVAMEATGVYWKPVWHVLEEACDLVLANAAHVRAIPGRKSDTNDARWLADLLAHGLIRASFVPPTAIQELRDLTRTRTQLVREVAQHTLRIQKTLEDANIKITGVVTDLLGVSGRALLTGLDDNTLAELYAGIALDAISPLGPSSLPHLRQIIHEDRHRGFSINRSDFSTAIATPIKNFAGQVVAAINVSAPDNLMGDESVRDNLTALLRKTAARISDEVGG